MRYYYSSKALYTIDFFKAYAEYVKPFIISANGKAKKALIFDCDNTLWKGILGEDGFDNIEMSTHTKDGNIFAEIQSMALAINKQGILIGLCSKNNPGDVDEVIQSHPDMQLRDEHITINKSNWSNKVTNLKEIATELNIGLDSLVFVDDSSFEVNLISEQLPEITVLQVPERLYEYPKMLRGNLELFYNLSLTAEDQNKIKMYKQQVKRESIKKEFTDIEDYLASLELKMTIFEDDESIIPRMSQMTQKTNQFNLTTKRYTEGDVRNFIDDLDSNVYAFSVADKFGDSGVTGLCIVSANSKNESAEIDTLLMSCRIIGRNIEYAFMDHVIGKTKEKKISVMKAKYIKTRKNEQVKEFYDKCSFDLVDQNESVREYSLETKNYETKNLNYIEVING
jgi:FkbH-like protein